MLKYDSNVMIVKTACRVIFTCRTVHIHVLNGGVTYPVIGFITQGLIFTRKRVS